MISNTDSKPRFAICHVALAAADIKLLGEFYTSIGMRPVVVKERMAILELRGGTHLVISKGPPGENTIDLMVDDLDETWQLLQELGTEPTAIVPGSPHNTFRVNDPEGNVVVVESSHATGPV